MYMSLQGMMAAYTIGWIDGVGSLATAGSTPPKTVKAVMDYMGTRAPNFSKSFGTYVHEIDDFYIDNPESLRFITGNHTRLPGRQTGLCLRSEIKAPG